MKHDLPPAHGIDLDPFQLEAIDAIDRGHSVLVAAPTSSGKTMVAHYGIADALAQDLTVAYTTPTKALSNQKLRELSSWLGDDVGLMTGDNVIRPNAAVLVMTTEVLRNMMYSGSSTLERMGTVVLDEVHFLEDRYRGAVWEEVIISLHRHVRLVCLSATVANADELGGWIRQVRGSCEVVVSRERPVSLSDHFLVFDRGERRTHAFSTMKGGRPNEDVERFLQRSERAKSGRQRAGGGRGSGRNANRAGGVRPARPRRSEVIAHLAEAEHLPAIVFVFSRQGCDEAVIDFLASGMTFLDVNEAGRARQIAEAHTQHLSDDDLALLGYERWVAGLEAGVAAHHAGLVPPFKEATEECFGAGLLSVVFATETLAVGVNMPARSVVIEQLTRFGGEGFVMLTPGQYTQLTGRAGRRGLDDEGHAYTLWSPHVSFTETAQLVASNAFQLESSFAPTYNMAANLVATRSRQDAAALLRQTFAQYQADRRGHGTQLSKALGDRVAVMERLGLAQGWELTEPGRTLRRIFHEKDLLATLAVHAGVFDGLKPSELAAVVSCITYEHRNRLRPAEPEVRSTKLAGRLAQIEALADDLVDAEQAGGVPESPLPDRCLFDVVLRWGKGRGLAEALGAEVPTNGQPADPLNAETQGANRWSNPEYRRRRKEGRSGVLSIAELLSVGDFVRQMRQLADLLNQLSFVAPDADTRRCAASAARAVLRGVVAETSNTQVVPEVRITETRSSGTPTPEAQPAITRTRRLV